MANQLVLSLFVKRLIKESMMSGSSTPQDKKSFQSRVRGVNEQLIIQTDVLIHNNTSTSYIIFVESNDIAPPVSSNTICVELLELLTSLEEDCFAIHNGDVSDDRKHHYNITARAFRDTLKSLTDSLGV